MPEPAPPGAAAPEGRLGCGCAASALRAAMPGAQRRPGDAPLPAARAGTGQLRAARRPCRRMRRIRKRISEEGRARPAAASIRKLPKASPMPRWLISAAMPRPAARPAIGPIHERLPARPRRRRRRPLRRAAGVRRLRRGCRRAVGRLGRRLALHAGRLAAAQALGLGLDRRQREGRSDGQRKCDQPTLHLQTPSRGRKHKRVRPETLSIRLRAEGSQCRRDTVIEPDSRGPIPCRHLSRR